MDLCGHTKGTIWVSLNQSCENFQESTNSSKSNFCGTITLLATWKLTQSTGNRILTCVTSSKLPRTKKPGRGGFFIPTTMTFLEGHIIHPPSVPALVSATIKLKDFYTFLWEPHQYKKKMRYPQARTSRRNGLASICLLAMIPSATIAFTSPSFSANRIRSATLYSSEEKDSVLFATIEGDSSNNSTASGTAQFGEVVRLPKRTDESQFGDVIRLNKPSEEIHSPLLVGTTSSLTEKLEERKRNNLVVAALSISLAFVNYFWQWTHPISAIQLLYTMEQSSAPVTAIANNGKPTVVDFWAPWCENCKQMAPTLYQVEQEYSDRINFIMVNGDAPEAWPLIETFGVDAIPHLAMVEADGTVDTALIGPVPKAWLEKDLQVLLENSKLKEQTNRATLPYKMLDAFANRPDERKIQPQHKQ